MAFQFPKLLSPRDLTPVIYERNLTDGLPVCKPSDVKKIKPIGSGSFGFIFLCQMQGKECVLKKLIDEDADTKHLFLKEARVMNKINHPNIIKFLSLYQETEIENPGIIMEYMVFNFKQFGYDFEAYSLRDFLTFIDIHDCKGFEHLPPFVATDVCSGLSYLHDNDIVHRDLKPENILVSNQHFYKLDRHTFNALRLNKPVVAKVADFGECRAKLIQTATLVHSRTNNIFRGTLMYMAPEIFFHDGTKHLGLQDLQQFDIWSYSMILFALFNPDLDYPYQLEYSKEIQSVNTRPAEKMLKKLFGRHELPCNSQKYHNARLTHWSKIVDTYNMCATFGIRPDMRTILSSLTKEPENREGSRFRFTKLKEFKGENRSGEFLNAQNMHNMEHCEEEMPHQHHSGNELVDITITHNGYHELEPQIRDKNPSYPEDCYGLRSLYPEDYFGLNSEDYFGLNSEDYYGLNSEDYFGLNSEDYFGLNSEDYFGLNSEDYYGLNS